MNKIPKKPQIWNHINCSREILKENKISHIIIMDQYGAIFQIKSYSIRLDGSNIYLTKTKNNETIKIYDNYFSRANVLTALEKIDE